MASMTAGAAWSGNIAASSSFQVRGHPASMAAGRWWATRTKRDTAEIRSSRAECCSFKCLAPSPDTAPRWSRATLSRGRYGSHRPRIASITSPMPSASPNGHRQ
eukprot:208457-Pyramimonas_sp.AAC.1